MTKYRKQANSSYKQRYSNTPVAINPNDRFTHIIDPDIRCSINDYEVGDVLQLDDGIKYDVVDIDIDTGRLVLRLHGSPGSIAFEREVK